MYEYIYIYIYIITCETLTWTLTWTNFKHIKPKTVVTIYAPELVILHCALFLWSSNSLSRIGRSSEIKKWKHILIYPLMLNGQTCFDNLAVFTPQNFYVWAFYNIIHERVNSLSANPKKMPQPTNCLSVWPFCGIGA